MLLPRRWSPFWSCPRHSATSGGHCGTSLCFADLKCLPNSISHFLSPFFFLVDRFCPHHQGHLTPLVFLNFPKALLSVLFCSSLYPLHLSDGDVWDTEMCGVCGRKCVGHICYGDTRTRRHNAAAASGDGGEWRRYGETSAPETCGDTELW